MLIKFGSTIFLIIWHSSFTPVSSFLKYIEAPGGRRKASDANKSIRGENYKSRGTTRDFGTRSHMSPHSLKQGWANNAATRPKPTKRSLRQACLWVGRLRDQYTRRAPCLLAPSAGSLKSGPRRLLPITVFNYFSDYTLLRGVCQASNSGDRNAAAVPCPGPLLYGIFLFISRTISATSMSPSTSSSLTGLPALFGQLSQ